MAKAFVEIIGHELQYGPWTVMLRSERQILCVVMTGPDDTHEEWAFNLGLSGLQAPAEMVDELRKRFRTGNGRPNPRAPGRQASHR